MELGVELIGGKQYTACQALSDKCWVYFKKGIQQVNRPKDTYTYY